MSSSKELILEEVAIEFREWRSGKKYKQERIPKNLWLKASDLTLSHSPTRVAQKLGLNLKDLKQRMKPIDPPESIVKSPQEFIETQLLFSSIYPVAVYQSVEFERVDGSRMKLYASQDQSFDLHALMSLFLEGNHAASHPTD